MKTMTCNQLGGPGECTFEFHGETFDEIARQSKEHAMEVVEIGDTPHQQKMKEMGELMQRDPEAAQNLFAKWQEEFESLKAG